MSPLAGPVSAAAVILKPGTRITDIDDSKKLDANSREALAIEIKEKAAAWSVAFVEVEEIDTINIYWAGILAMRRAVEGLGVTPQHLLIDAKRLKEIAIPQQAIIKGDTKSASIAAASIFAKVSRDALMRTLDTRHPGYGFADHKGYPVRAHYDALSRLGACAAHRRSFGPVREVLGLPPLPPWPPASERGGALSGAEAKALRAQALDLFRLSENPTWRALRSWSGWTGAVTVTSWPSRSAIEAAAIAASNAASFVAYSFSALPSWRTRQVPSVPKISYFAMPIR